jgi:hypothetical protein
VLAADRAHVLLGLLEQLGVGPQVDQQVAQQRAWPAPVGAMLGHAARCPSSAPCGASLGDAGHQLGGFALADRQ